MAEIPPGRRPAKSGPLASSRHSRHEQARGTMRRNGRMPKRQGSRPAKCGAEQLILTPKDLSSLTKSCARLRRDGRMARKLRVQYPGAMYQVRLLLDEKGSNNSLDSAEK